MKLYIYKLQDHCAAKQKSHTSPNTHSFETVFDDANVYEHFLVDTQFESDFSIGLFTENSLVWKVMLGGWGGTGSRIINGGTGGDVAAKTHTKSAFDFWKHDITVKSVGFCF